MSNEGLNFLLEAGCELLPLEMGGGSHCRIDREDWKRIFHLLKEKSHGRSLWIHCIAARPLLDNAHECFVEAEWEGSRLLVSTRVPMGKNLESLRDIWPFLDWQEQEVFDQFSLTIDGCMPHLARLQPAPKREKFLPESS